MHHATDLEWFTQECAGTNCFAELLPLAFAELNKFPGEVEIVCGPISTGGRGSVEANVAVFEATIRALQRRGRPIFSQVPYEERIFFFRKRWRESDPANAGKYYMPILEEFYLPIFQTRRIIRAWFIPGWESSFGARWERAQLIELGTDTWTLSKDWINFIMREDTH